ncbi:hypothetical protein BpsS140_00034 [Bacillus phage vB_BpsS-140]|nr:hypothetical protein BpsS140_00034 [Bacillus phage vB_BpsS-140]
MSSKLQVRVSGIDFTYSEGAISGVTLRFNVTDPLGKINSNGRVDATTEEYMTAHFSEHGIEALPRLVAKKIAERYDIGEDIDLED